MINENSKHKIRVLPKAQLIGAHVSFHATAHYPLNNVRPRPTEKERRCQRGRPRIKVIDFAHSIELTIAACSFSMRVARRLCGPSWLLSLVLSSLAWGPILKGSEGATCGFSNNLWYFGGMGFHRSCDASIQELLVVSSDYFMYSLLRKDLSCFYDSHKNKRFN